MAIDLLSQLPELFHPLREGVNVDPWPSLRVEFPNYAGTTGHSRGGKFDAGLLPQRLLVSLTQNDWTWSVSLDDKVRNTLGALCLAPLFPMNSLLLQNVMSTFGSGSRSEYHLTAFLKMVELIWRLRESAVHRA